ncbi:MAG TPA: pentapeptide repeat-containing protein, partial [Planctomycetota bacterium]
MSETTRKLALDLLSAGQEGVQEWNSSRGAEAADQEDLPSLAGADLSKADLRGVDLHGIDLQEAILKEANLDGANLRGANLTRATLDGAILGGADLSEARMPLASLRGANLNSTKLRNAWLLGAQLTGAKLTRADFSGAMLLHANLSNAEISFATFNGANVAGIRYSRKGLSKNCRATLVSTSLGNPLFVRHVEDELFINALARRSNSSKFLVWLWWLTSDCGRSFFRLSCWFVAIALGFGILYSNNPDWFEVKERIGVGSPFPTQLTPFYFSVVTLTTLGFGDVTPITPTSEVVVVLEV